MGFQTGGRWFEPTDFVSRFSTKYLHVLIYYRFVFLPLQTVHVITQRHLGHFTCLWENCRHYGISYNCAPSWPDHHVLSHTGKTFECFIPGCKRIFKTEVRIFVTALLWRRVVQLDADHGPLRIQQLCGSNHRSKHKKAVHSMVYKTVSCLRNLASKLMTIDN